MDPIIFTQNNLLLLLFLNPHSNFSPESSDEYLNEPGIIHNGVIFDWRRSSLVVKGLTLILRNSFRCKNEASYLKLR